MTAEPIRRSRLCRKQLHRDVTFCGAPPPPRSPTMTNSTVRSDSELKEVLTLWYVAYDGITRDSFWSARTDPDDAHKEYCDARHWLHHDRVEIF